MAENADTPSNAEKHDNLHARFVADSSGSPNREFLDDLSALNRFKAFLVGKGVEVPERTIARVNELTYVFAADLANYENKSPQPETAAAASPVPPPAKGEDVQEIIIESDDNKSRQF